jgi:serine/threonine-protein kinase
MSAHAEHVACPAIEQLECAVFTGELSADLAAHLVSCERCRAVVQQARADHALLSEIAELALPRAAVQRGASLGGPRSEGPPSGTPAGFEVLGEIHRGGQGVVFDAIQKSTNRRVALKTLLRGAFATRDERRRFEREVEIVASLRHPGIVTLFESGIAEDGAGWFAMEYVDGLTLDQHLMAFKPPRRERVRLLRSVAEAVSHAHQRGVIHRDLKPGNILVTADGDARVLDFGLARPVELERALGVTADGRFVGTLAYAAPEQLAGQRDVDVRADVYALGLILYEALVGARPVDGAVSLDEFLRARREPVPTRTLVDAGADADLRAIVSTATAPEPPRRYQSCAAFAEDLERWLEGRPVAARADSPGYLLLRAARRHWVAVGASAIIALLVGASAITSTLLLLRVQRQRAESERTLHAFTDALLAADPLAAEAVGPTVADFLDGAGQRLEQSLADDPQVAVRVRSTLGSIAMNLAELDRAERDFTFVLQTTRELEGPDSPAAARALHELGRVKYRRGEFAAASSLYEESLAIRKAALGPVHPDVAATAGHLAACRRRLGQLESSEGLYRESLAIREVFADEAPEALAESLNNLATFLMDRGRVDEAVLLLERALEMILKLRGPTDWRTARTWSNLAGALLERGEITRAKALLDASAGVWAERVEPDHPHSVAVQLLRSRCDLAEGDIAGAARGGAA